MAKTTEKFCATIESDEEWVSGGLGSTPDEAFDDWAANYMPDDVANICCETGETVNVEIWSTCEPNADERAEGYTYMLDKLIETRNYVAKEEDLHA